MRLVRLFSAFVVLVVLGWSSGANAASIFAIPGGEITYVYPLDYGEPGPGQGDSAQPRSDIGADNGDSGGELTNGVFGGPYNEPHDAVAFNEYNGANAGTDTSHPQPRIHFDLGGTYNLVSTRIDYWTGGNGALVGPELVEISVSTDGGLTYSASPDVSYSGFDRTDENNGLRFSAGDTIAIIASGVTNVRMDFFQGNWSHAPGTSNWVILQEVSFNAIPEPSTALLLGLGLAGMTAARRRRVS